MGPKTSGPDHWRRPPGPQTHMTTVAVLTHSHATNPLKSLSGCLLTVGVNLGWQGSCTFPGASVIETGPRSQDLELSSPSPSFLRVPGAGLLGLWAPSSLRVPGTHCSAQRGTGSLCRCVWRCL